MQIKWKMLGFFSMKRREKRPPAENNRILTRISKFQLMLLTLCYTAKQGDVRPRLEKLSRVVYQEVIFTRFSWDWLMYDSK